MYLKACPSHNGKIYLSFVQGYRDENGKSKQRTIEKLGYLDDLKKLYDDPIKHFKEIAKSKNSDEIHELTIKNLNSKIIEMGSNYKNMGYMLLKKVYDELGIKEFLNSKQKNLKINYNINDILSMLVFMRVIKPGSKRNNFENMNILFENYNFSLDDIYYSLSLLCPLKEEIQTTICNNTKNAYNRDTSCSYYDCTNYYFEIEYDDEDIFEYDKNGNLILNKDGTPKISEVGVRRRGPEKNHRPDPIVELGLLMDATFIPLSFDVFPGNESEKNSLIPIFNRTRRDFELSRTIVVADRGLNNSDNVIKISGISLEESLKKNGYVYGKSVRGADEEFKNWVLNQNNYITEKVIDENGNEILFKHKSRIHPQKMNIIRDDKGKTKNGNPRRESILIDQKQMVYYSQKYANKQKKDREMIIKKANDLISHPANYNRATSYGVAGYVNNLKFVKSTGEIADTDNLTLNKDKIKEEEKYDGYYAIVTSEENLSDYEIRKIYKGLSRIEESFKITKTGIEGRPVYVSRKDRIMSHFLTCFIALTIIRLIEKKLNGKYPFNQIIDSIRNLNSINLEHDIYIQTFRNNLIVDAEKQFNIDLSKKYLTLSQIKKILK